MSLQDKRMTTAREMKKIKKLSATHLVKDIAAITGIGKMTILKIPLNPKNGIVNPKRKYYKKAIIRSEVKLSKVINGEEYFDVDAYAKILQY